MFIDKIPWGSIVELHCSLPGRDNVVFSTSAVVGGHTKDKVPFLYVDSVMQGERRVNFEHCSVTAYIVNRGDRRRYMFQITGATNVKNAEKDEFLLMLQCSDDAKPLNFRRAERIPCVVSGEFYFDRNERSFPCKVRDVSACGIAFTTAQENVPKIQSDIVVEFAMSEYNMSYKFFVQVVRTQIISGTEILVGCDAIDYCPSLVALCNYLKADKSIT